MERTGPVVRLKPNFVFAVFMCAGQRTDGTGRYEGAKAEMANAVPAAGPRPALAITRLSALSLPSAPDRRLAQACSDSTAS
jgi:hypothetical protein